MTEILLVPEVRARLGVTEDPLTRAHLGFIFFAQAAPIVVVPPATAPKKKRTKRRITQTISQQFYSPGPLGPLTVPREPTLDEKLECSARIVPEFARQEDTQRWVSAVLTASSEDLTADLGVAAALLSATQAIVKAPLDKVVLLAASLSAAALPVFLVAHDDRPLLAVHVDGEWRYADPGADAELGTHLPFVRERFFSVPNLPTPELSLVKQKLEEARREIAATRLAHEEQILVYEQQILAYETEIERRSRWLQTVVIVGAILIAILVARDRRLEE